MVIFSDFLGDSLKVFMDNFSIFGDDFDNCLVTNQDCEVLENTRSRAKIKSKLTNFKNNSWIEGYNGKYGSNPQGIMEILDDLFEFDQIRQWIGDKTWKNCYFME